MKTHYEGGDFCDLRPACVDNDVKRERVGIHLDTLVHENKQRMFLLIKARVEGG